MQVAGDAAPFLMERALTLQGLNLAQTFDTNVMKTKRGQSNQQSSAEVKGQSVIKMGSDRKRESGGLFAPNAFFVRGFNKEVVKTRL